MKVSKVFLMHTQFDLGRKGGGLRPPISSGKQTSTPQHEEEKDDNEGRDEIRQSQSGFSVGINPPRNEDFSHPSSFVDLFFSSLVVLRFSLEKFYQIWG